MKLLVTGGTGVVGTAAVRHLLGRGHTVRLFSRHARHDAAQFSGPIEAREGSVQDSHAVDGAAEGCDAILHAAGIVAESPPASSFAAVNVEGTRHLLAEGERAAVRRFVYVSSLGAERGGSDYHRSKREAEALVTASSLDWLVLRPGNVYGPGDEVISLLLRMVRTLPAIPVVEGDTPFQPVWADDLGEGIVRALERPDLVRRTLDLAGTELTTVSDLLDRLERLTGRSPARLPVPAWLAQAGAGLAAMAGVELPVNADQITMLVEGNVIPPDHQNALTDLLHVTPTSLDAGLAALADCLPEQLPSEGLGGLTRHRFGAEIVGSSLTPAELLDLVRHRFAELAPSATMRAGAEPSTPTELEPGATISLALPGRGTVQVRVEEVTEHSITCITLEGHPLAGAVRFLAEQRGPALLFEVQTYDRPATLPDLVAIDTLGRPLQAFTWRTVVERTVEASGGVAPRGVEDESEVLDEDEAREVEEWLDGMVMARKRAAGGA